MNNVRARIFDEARTIETSSSELSKQVDSARKLVNHVLPYITNFEQLRWLAGIG